MLSFADGNFTYQMSILKSADAAGSGCTASPSTTAPKPGVGHFLHTYVCDGSPIPTFQGEPERVAICGDIDEMTRQLWENLDENNKISLYVRFTDLASGQYEERVCNKNR
jgi:IMP cyclohydrolase